jgi:leader peptidase (prepilin peptidase)/N-methyltransferase
VVIYRLPRGESIILPPSHCPQCDHRLGLWDLIPVFSYLGLRGKCRYCRTRISARYSVVELLSPGLTLLWWYRVGRYEWNADGLALLVVTYALVAVSLIDYDRQIIPDKITLPLLVAGLTLRAVQGKLGFAALGLLAGGGPLGLLALCYAKGMGWGDVKLLAMLGVFLGWPKVITVIFLGSLFGVLWMAPLMLFGKYDRKTPFAFGPFLAAAALVVIYFGEELMLGWKFWIGV